MGSSPEKKRPAHTTRRRPEVSWTPKTLTTLSYPPRGPHDPGYHILVSGLVVSQRRVLVLLLLVEMERMLQFVTQALAVWRLGVAAVLLLVDIAGTASLWSGQPCSVATYDRAAYSSVEFILRVALVDLRHHVDGATFVRLWPNARRLANVACSATAS